MEEETRPIEVRLVSVLSDAVLSDVLAHQRATRDAVKEQGHLSVEQKAMAIDHWRPPTASQRAFYVRAMLRALRSLPVEERAAICGFVEAEVTTDITGRIDLVALDFDRGYLPYEHGDSVYVESAPLPAGREKK